MINSPSSSTGKLLVYFFLTFFVLQANAQTESPQAFVIKGSVKGVNSGKVFMLSEGWNDPIDSAVVVHGQFVMKGKIRFPQAKIFAIMPGKWCFRAFIEHSITTVSVDTADAQRDEYRNVRIWEIKETGSEMADAYAKYYKETDQTYCMSLYKKLKTETDTTERISIKNEIDSLGIIIREKLKPWIESYITQNPSAIIGAFLFNEAFVNLAQDKLPSDLQSLANKFSGAAKTSAYYKEIITKINNLKNKELNALAPDFTLLKRDKSKFTLSSTRGKFTMIAFGASWSTPYWTGIPHWKEIYEKYHQKGFDIVSVFNDRYRKYWISALNKEQIPWTQVIDEFPPNGSEAKVISLYGAPYVPYFILLDKEGKVVLASGYQALMTEKIEEIFQ
jgi:peroxiredoxin